VNPRFLLIAYDIDQPKDIGHARRKWITKQEYQQLETDFIVDVDLNLVSYLIVGRRTAIILGEFDKTLLVIIDVKKK
jgi:hypothetical protein